MIRVVFFLIVIGALALGAAWLADRPGDVLITWQGWRVETSLMVMGTAILTIVIALMALWTLLRAIVSSPALFSRFRQNRRGERAYAAMSRGLIAVGSGDASAARKFMSEVNRIAPHEPLALLLTAQAAQLSGDRDAAERAFRTMAGRSETKVLGLHGLFIEAQRHNDMTAARAYAEEAARSSPSLGWAGQAVLEFRCATGDWAGALALLERSKGTLDKTSYRRQRAVLLIARALAVEDTDRDNARAFALEAVKLAPTLVPAAAFAGRVLAEAGDRRKATRILEKAWRANPHPDLAAVYAQIRLGDSARDRLARIETLVKKGPNDLESALALARASLYALEFAKARAALAPLLAAPTRRVALLMAELERAERADEGRSREWMARAVNAAPDPAWTADGFVSEQWRPVSPISGRLDAFQWKVPVSGVVGAGPLLEPVAEATLPALDVLPPPAQPASPAVPNDAVEAVAASAAASRRPARAPSRPDLKPELRQDLKQDPKMEPKPEPRPDAVIPLVHAPDDPGPDDTEQPEAVPEQPPDGWRKIFK